jgi:hypothetical protein
MELSMAHHLNWGESHGPWPTLAPKSQRHWGWEESHNEWETGYIQKNGSNTLKIMGASILTIEERWYNSREKKNLITRCHIVIRYTGVNTGFQNI